MPDKKSVSGQLRWWVFLVVGFLFLPVAYMNFASDIDTEAVKARAMSSQMPDLVDLGTFTRSENATPAGEVNIVAQVSDGYDLGAPGTVGGHAFVLHGAADAEGSDIARGIIFVHNKEYFQNWLRGHALGTGTFSAIYQINGMSLAPTQSRDDIEAALAGLGMEMSDNFIAVVPFLNGRDAAFAPSPQNMLLWPILLFGLGLLHIAYGLYKRREQSKKRADMQVFLDNYSNGVSVPAE